MIVDHNTEYRSVRQYREIPVETLRYQLLVQYLILAIGVHCTFAMCVARSRYKYIIHQKWKWFVVQFTGVLSDVCKNGNCSLFVVAEDLRDV